MIAGQNPQRILGCPICGYRVDPKDHTCPRCGSEFYEGTKFECPLCGGLVSAKDRSCPSCHVDYSDFRDKTIARGSDDGIDALLTEIIDLESEQVRKEDRRYSCPICSWMLDGSESVCPRCNHDLVTDLSFQCPVCGTIVSSNTKACPECGARFDEVQGPAKGMMEEPEPEVAEVPEPQPAPAMPPEQHKEVKPVLVVKPKVVARPEQRTSPEPPAQQPPEPVPVPPQAPPEPSAPEPPLESVEQSLAKMEARLEIDEELEKAPGEPTAAAAQTPKKGGTKKRKLKAKPKG